MSIKHSLRGWHAWWSVILAAPILIVALTAVLIAHDKALQLREIPVAAHWLPGYASQPGAPPALEVRAWMQDGDGIVWIGTKDGLLRVQNGVAQAVEAIGRTEVRSLVRNGDTLIAAAKTGVWELRNERWRQVLRGEAWSLQQGPSGAITVTLKEGKLYQRSADGQRWEQNQALSPVLSAYAERPETKPITLSRLVMDLHTGKALFGKEYEWIWIDVIGATMFFLGISGLIIWWRNQRARVRLAQAGQAGHSTPEPATLPLQSSAVAARAAD